MTCNPLSPDAGGVGDLDHQPCQPGRIRRSGQRPNDERRRPGRSPLTNKAVVFEARDGIATIGFTGVAHIGSTRTDDWIGEFLSDQPGLDIGQALEAIRRRAEVALRGVEVIKSSPSRAGSGLGGRGSGRSWARCSDAQMARSIFRGVLGIGGSNPERMTPSGVLRGCGRKRRQIGNKPSEPRLQSVRSWGR